jgi:hypothetical protein
MKRKILTFLLILAVNRLEASPERIHVGAILKTTSALELSATVSVLTRSRLRTRGCQIQQREGVPPTLCYPSKHDEQLDRLCEQASRHAVRLPSVDGFTSSFCRQAIEKREKDLAYAANRDALR